MQVDVPRIGIVALRGCYDQPRAGHMLKIANGTQGRQSLPWRCWCQGSDTLDAPGDFGGLLRKCALPGRNGEEEAEQRKRQEPGSQLSGEKKMKKRPPVSSANGSERGSCRTRTKMKKMKVAISWNSQGSRHSLA